MINAYNKFFVIVLGVEFFYLGNYTVLDVLVDDLVVLSVDVVYDKILA